MSRFSRIIFLVLIFTSSISVYAQESILDRYIRFGIENNLVLKERNLSFENAINALQQARSLYKPALDFQTLYSTAAGGRNIQLPVGDMLNPVYSTLNQLTGQNNFPMIKNEEINFLPKDYYDAKVRFSLPIINTDIRNNVHIHQKQSIIQEKDVIIYERELIKDIKTTYYNYLSILKVVEINRNALSLAEESERTNEKLINAGKGLYAYVLRSQTEIEQCKARLHASELQAETLRHYFNALLNRDPESEIEVDKNLNFVQPEIFEKGSASKREELQILEQAIEIRNDMVRMNEQVFTPKLNGFADIGSQAERLRINNESFYYMVGLQLNIPLFNGGRNRMKIKSAQNESEIIKLQKENTAQQLNVAVTKAYNELLTAHSDYNASKKQLEMAETYYRLITKGYNSGVNTYIETVDARTQLTDARLGASVNYYRILSAEAVLEREKASYPINNLKQK